MLNLVLLPSEPPVLGSFPVVGCKSNAHLVCASSLAACNDDISWEAADAISLKDAIWLVSPFLEDATSCSFKTPFATPAVAKTVILAPPTTPPDPTPSSTVVVICSVEDLGVIARMSFSPDSSPGTQRLCCFLCATVLFPIGSLFFVIRVTVWRQEEGQQEQQGQDRKEQGHQEKHPAWTT